VKQFYYFDVDSSLLDEQRALIGGMVTLLGLGKPVTTPPTDRETLIGLEYLLDAIADQLDGVAHNGPDPFKMGRAELVDYYNNDTGDTLNDVFGCDDWELENGREHVAGSLGLEG